MLLGWLLTALALHEKALEKGWWKALVASLVGPDMLSTLCVVSCSVVVYAAALTYC